MLARTDSTEKLKNDLVLAYGKDPILAARSLCPHWFSRPMPWYARGIIAVILRRADFLLNFGDEQWQDGQCRWTKKKLAKLVRCFQYKIDPTNPNSPTAPIFRLRYAEDGRTPVAIDMVLGTHVCLIIPRGFSKTTLINFCNIYKTLYRLTRFTVYISEAANHAKDQLATIRRELSGNDRITALFGQLKPDRTDDESWGAESFETTTGVKFAAKGRGAQIRGLNKFGDRPDTEVLDDVEDRESVSTDVQRDKTKSWFKSDVEQALRRDRESYIYAIGTMLHPEALLPTLASDATYTTVQLGAIDPEGEALWDDPAGMSLEAIAKKKLSFAHMGKLYEFSLEYLSDARSNEQAKFRKEWFNYEICKPSDFIARAIHVDPAISNKPGADFACIAVVGLKESGHKHVCDVLLRQGITMSKLIEEYFRMKIEWDCTHHSSESTAYQAALAQGIREQMAIYAKTYGMKAFFEIRDVWPGGRKDERVEGILQPLMAARYISFQKCWPELEVQFMDWPRGKKDGPDAIASAISNLEPFATLSFGDPKELEKGFDDSELEHIAPCAAGSGAIP